MNKTITIQDFKKKGFHRELIDYFECNYINFEGTIGDILNLESLPYSHKVYLAVKLLPHKTIQLWSLEYAKLFLPLFENLFPNETRVRESLDIIEKVINNETSCEEIEKAENIAFEVFKLIRLGSLPKGLIPEEFLKIEYVRSIRTWNDRVAGMNIAKTVGLIARGIRLRDFAVLEPREEVEQLKSLSILINLLNIG